MRRYILLPFALIFLCSPPAGAQDIPGPVQQIIDEARAQCEPAHGRFQFTPNAVRRADFNRDDAIDYILSAAAFLCSGTNEIYKTPTGYPHYLFLSSGPHILRLDRNASINAFDYSIENTSPPQLIYTQPCPGNPGAAITQSRWGWTGTTMSPISSTPPCSR